MPEKTVASARTAIHTVPKRTQNATNHAYSMEEGQKGIDVMVILFGIIFYLGLMSHMIPAGNFRGEEKEQVFYMFTLVYFGFVLGLAEFLKYKDRMGGLTRKESTILWTFAGIILYFVLLWNTVMDDNFRNNKNRLWLFILIHPVLLFGIHKFINFRVPKPPDEILFNGQNINDMDLGTKINFAKSFFRLHNKSAYNSQNWKTNRENARSFYRAALDDCEDNHNLKDTRTSLLKSMEFSALKQYVFIDLGKKRQYLKEYRKLLSISTLIAQLSRNKVAECDICKENCKLASFPCGHEYCPDCYANGHDNNKCHKCQSPVKLQK